MRRIVVFASSAFALAALLAELTPARLDRGRVNPVMTLFRDVACSRDVMRETGDGGTMNPGTLAGALRLDYATATTDLGGRHHVLHVPANLAMGGLASGSDSA